MEHAGMLKNNQLTHECKAVPDNSVNKFHFTPAINNRLLNDSLKNEIRSIILYLDNNHGFSSINTWFAQNIDSLIRIQSGSNQVHPDEASVYMSAMGVQDSYSTVSDDVSTSFFIHSGASNKLLHVKDYDWLYRMNECELSENPALQQKFQIDGTYFSVYTSEANSKDLIIDNGVEKTIIHSKELIDSCLQTNNKNFVPEEKMNFLLESKQWSYKLLIQKIDMEKTKGEWKIKKLDAIWLFRKK